MQNVGHAVQCNCEYYGRRTPGGAVQVETFDTSVDESACFQRFVETNI